jgi:hypothetical protein
MAVGVGCACEAGNACGGAASTAGCMSDITTTSNSRGREIKNEKIPSSLSRGVPRLGQEAASVSHGPGPGLYRSCEGHSGTRCQWATVAHWHLSGMIDSEDRLAKLLNFAYTKNHTPMIARRHEVAASPTHDSCSACIISVGVAQGTSATIGPLSPSPHANSFVIGTAVTLTAD